MYPHSVYPHSCQSQSLFWGSGNPWSDSGIDTQVNWDRFWFFWNPNIKKRANGCIWSEHRSFKPKLSCPVACSLSFLKQIWITGKLVFSRTKETLCCRVIPLISFRQKQHHQLHLHQSRLVILSMQTCKLDKRNLHNETFVAFIYFLIHFAKRLLASVAKLRGAMYRKDQFTWVLD